MKILLAGEYSRLHNSLKEGLEELGHQVVIVSLGDGFKDYPSDIKLKERFQKGFLRRFKNLVYLLTGFDFESLNVYLQIRKKVSQRFDIVQFINENSFQCEPFFEKKIFDYLTSKAKKSFLLSCGTDAVQVVYALEHKDYKSVLTPLHNGVISESEIPEILKYTKKNYTNLSQYIYSKISGVVATDWDYVEALQHNPKFLGFIPYPINIKKISNIGNFPTTSPIIFHGINKFNFYKKGNDIFQKALQIVREKCPKIKIVETENLPYHVYIQQYNACHILLDQAYAKDQGYNALEAMAKGKVVFTGAEKDFLDYYHIEADNMCVNAIPNAEYVAEKLMFFIENPEKLTEIHYNARRFVEKHHHYIDIAKKYVEIWENTP